MALKRYYTNLYPNKVFEMFEWNNVDVVIRNDKTGEIIFEGYNLEFPAHYSKSACDIIAKMYFRKSGVPDTIHEVSMKQVAERMIKFWTLSALDEKVIMDEDADVFYDELMFMLLNQMWAPNSPQWFNTGLLHKYGIKGNPSGHYYWDENKKEAVPAPDGYGRSQSSACFIVNVEDSLMGNQSLLDNLATATRLFKYGSGIGLNWSKIRGAGEALSDGGKSSGLMSFLKVFDVNAGTIKSGGVCLAPFQKVYTDKGAIEVKRLAYEGEKFYILSFDPRSMSYKAKYATAFLSGYKNVKKLITNKGEFFLSYDHPVLLSPSRKCVEVQDLVPGQVLFTCQTYEYENNIVIDTKKDYVNFSNIIVDAHYEYDARNRIEHIDGNFKNNFINNLSIIDDIAPPLNIEFPKFDIVVINIEDVGIMDVYDVEVECDTPNTPTPDSGHNFVIWPADRDDFFGCGLAVHNTRRAAVMQVLNDDHPDLLEFIRWKSREEDKAVALGIMGYSTTINGDAYETVSGQNVNNSISLTDKFMNSLSVKDAKWKLTGRVDNSVDKEFLSKDIWEELCWAAYRCGDPGVQFTDTINKWHTCPNSGKIVSSNPCFTGDMRLLTKDGYIPIGELENQTITLINKDGDHNIGKVWCSGKKEIIILRLSNGNQIRCTPDHIFLGKNNKEIKAMDMKGIQLMPLLEFNNKFDEEYMRYGFIQGDGSLNRIGDKYKHHQGLEIYIGEADDDILELFKLNKEMSSKSKPSSYYLDKSYNYIEKLLELGFQPSISSKRLFPTTYKNWSNIQKQSFLRGCFSANGSVISNTRISYKTTSIEFALTLLETLREDFGIKCYMTKNKPKIVTFSNGDYLCKESYDINIHHYESIQKFLFRIGFIQEYKLKSLRELLLIRTPKVVGIRKGGEELVYDFSEPLTNWGIVEGFIVHNCSEFLFINDSSCNLASINVLKFYNHTTKEFDINGFIHAIKFIQIAMDATIHWGYYPTPEMAENTYKFRANGLGITNLGALLMAMAIPYDSDEGRNFGAAIYSLLTGTSYYISAIMASATKPFYEYENNKSPMLNVINMHQNACDKLIIPSENEIDMNPEFYNQYLKIHSAAKEAWDQVKYYGETYGFRNAQASLAAPCGTISFAMDSSSTGIEPFYSHVIYKKLIDGSYMKLINGMIPITLKRLNYTSEEIKDIEKYMLENDGNFEKAPYLKPEHIPIFDTASKNGNGERFIDPIGHVKMIAALTPHMSGGISKTVNLPNNSSVEDIKNIYYNAWKMGCKCIALFRDGCKSVQPLTTKKEDIKSKEDINNLNYYELLSYTKTLLNDRQTLIKRERLPSHPHCEKDRVKMADITFHINRSFYDDGRLGELFVTVGKQGSTVKGLMEVMCVLISKFLQYGIPAEEISKIMRSHEFDPKGFVDEHPYIKNASSIVDLISKFIDISNNNYQFCQVKPDSEEKVIINKVSNELESNSIKKEYSDGERIYGETCYVCGSNKLIKAGTCKYCASCGTSTGCS